MAELNAADKLDPRPFIISTNPGSYWSAMRANCLMMSGQCPAGRQLMRRYMEKNLSSQMGPEAIDTQVDASAGMFCQGGTLTPRDQLLQANEAMRVGAQTKKDPAYCNQAYDRVKKAAAAVTPNGPDDTMINSAKESDQELAAAHCLSRAGDCAGAWTMLSRSKLASVGAAGFKSFSRIAAPLPPPPRAQLRTPPQRRRRRRPR